MGTKTWLTCDNCGSQGFASVGPSMESNPCSTKATHVVYNTKNGETVQILDNAIRERERGHYDYNSNEETGHLLCDNTCSGERSQMSYDPCNGDGGARTQVETVVECGSGGRWKVEVAAGGNGSSHHDHHVSILHYTKTVLWKAWNSLSPAVLDFFPFVHLTTSLSTPPDFLTLYSTSLPHSLLNLTSSLTIPHNHLTLYSTSLNTSLTTSPHFLTLHLHSTSHPSATSRPVL
ncbi:hypothetical protein Pmani_027434 [Petrolisthes manimaculis]|uniref:Uncharacterized protein n=1 Tax=Petrolisthes manimaculis TaxID=1843537 RepID=A0AAE1P1F3_9EUCA|nr:hypothetical protein Pmani_027434 [Petrolisthes manimaculis]